MSWSWRIPSSGSPKYYSGCMSAITVRVEYGLASCQSLCPGSTKRETTPHPSQGSPPVPPPDPPPPKPHLQSPDDTLTVPKPLSAIDTSAKTWKGREILLVEPFKSQPLRGVYDLGLAAGETGTNFSPAKLRVPTETAAYGTAIRYVLSQIFNYFWRSRDSLHSLVVN